MNQTLAIKNHLEKKGFITSIESFELYGATRLSAIIHVLRHKYGMDIEIEYRSKINRYGNTVSYGFYKLKEGKQNGEQKNV